MLSDDDLLSSMDAMRAMGIEPCSLPELREAINHIISNARHEAMEADSEINIPSEVWSLAALAEIATGQSIHAIKLGSYCTYEPDGSLPEGMSKFDWNYRRIFGPGNVSPPAKEIQHKGYAFLISGNPIIVEGWLKAQGLAASAGTPTTCIVEWPRKQ